MTDLLELTDVRSGYKDLTVVRDVSFAVSDSSITALLGPNGAGKTTLLRTIMGLNPLQQGAIRFRRTSIGGEPAHRRKVRGLGLVQENKRIFRKLTVEQNLTIGLHGVSSGRKEAASRRGEAYDRFPDLAAKKDHVAGFLSGGQQQMLAISQALMSHPQLLMLDEPFSGLAPSLVNEVADTIRNIRDKEGRTVLLVEQAVDAALDLADSVLVLDLGRLTYSGSASDPGTRQIVEEAYFSSQL